MSLPHQHTYRPEQGHHRGESLIQQGFQMSQKIYVTHVRSNVKGGVDVVLGPKTLVVGPSGSGKSAVVNSIELALGGFASDVVGRAEVSREIDLMALAPGRDGVLTSMVELSDGTVASYEAGGEKKKARVRLPSGLTADDIFPLRALREALLGSPATTRKFFLDQTGSGLSLSDIEGGLPGGLKEFFLTASQTYRASSLPPSTILLETLAAAKKRAADDSKAAKTTKAAVQVAAKDLPPEPSELELMTAKADVEKAQGFLASFSKSIGAIQYRQTLIAGYERTLASTDAELERLGNIEADLVKALTEAQTNYASLDTSPPDTLPEAFTTATKIMESMAELDAEECLVCGTAVTDALSAQITDRYNMILDATALQRDYVARVAKATATLRIAEQNATKWANDAERIEKNRADAFAKIEQLTEENDRAVAESASADEDALRTALDDANAHLTALTSAKVAWASTTKVIDAAVDADVSGAQWKKLAVALEGLVGSLLERGVAGFTKSVNETLPEGDVFSLRLQEGEREVCQYGLVREGVLHTALSGLEWARLTSAMAAVCSKASPLSLIIPEDRGWDPKMLASVMQSFTALPHQVVIATTIKPASIPTGWTLIERK